MDPMQSSSAERGAFGATVAAGGAAALIATALSLADVAIGAMTGGSVSALPPDAAGRFAELLARPALGLYHLDLINLVAALVLLPAQYACWLALRREGPAAGLALALGLVGAALFAASNAALPMLGLAREYGGADPSRRALLAAAGEALLANGAHGSPGALPGFLLPAVANLVLCGEMIRTKVFSRATGILGLAGNVLLSAYLVLVTFAAPARDAAMAFAAPGGVLAIAWMTLMALRLLGLSRAGRAGV